MEITPARASEEKGKYLVHLVEPCHLRHHFVNNPQLKHTGQGNKNRVCKSTLRDLSKLCAAETLKLHQRTPNLGGQAVNDEILSDVSSNEPHS